MLFCDKTKLLLVALSIVVGAPYLASGFSPCISNNKNRVALKSMDSQERDQSDEMIKKTAAATYSDDNNRRRLLNMPKTFAGVLLATNIGPPEVAWAKNSKSRTDGYVVQKSDAEWKAQLSDMQYYILRRGGTESPNSSILESEKRPGIFVCAGCGTKLFDANEKFNSRTGWPSFARGLEGVEVEQVDPISANLVGAELRCKTCGGHLGDVFNDGYLFVGTPAFVTGKRYCIDGAALVFQPASGDPEVKGDITKSKDELPSWLEPPKISPQS